MFLCNFHSLEKEKQNPHCITILCLFCTCTYSWLEKNKTQKREYQVGPICWTGIILYYNSQLHLLSYFPKWLPPIFSSLLSFPTSLHPFTHSGDNLASYFTKKIPVIIWKLPQPSKPTVPLHHCSYNVFLSVSVRKYLLLKKKKKYKNEA